MNRFLTAAVAAVVLAGCASAAPRPDRDVLPRILASLVQLRVELEGDDRRSGSGVVIASDPRSSRCWVITTRHLVEPPGLRRLSARVPDHGGSLSAEVVKVSDELDLAILSVQGAAPPAAELKEVAGLGQDVWVAGFPWGGRLTVVRGVVSQLAGDGAEARLEGPVRMVDAAVSYGASGGGVFEASSGLLIGIIEGYRTARVALPNAPESVLHVPMPGETTVISSAGVRRFLSSVNMGGLERAPHAPRAAHPVKAGRAAIRSDPEVFDTLISGAGARLSFSSLDPGHHVLAAPLLVREPDGHALP